MPKRDQESTVNLEEPIICSLATADALVKLLIHKGIISKPEFMRRLATERASGDIRPQTARLVVSRDPS